jgi:acyl-CoA thioesterase-1
VFKRELLFHIVSGQSFFSGLACLLAAIAISPAAKRDWLRKTRNLIAGIGGILIAISGTPLPTVLYVFLFLALLLWIWGESRREQLSRRSLRLVRSAVALAAVTAMLVETPYLLMPRLPFLGQPVVGVIGDSITAGIGEPGGSTWPGYLAERYGVNVRDHAASGATVSSALEQAKAMAADERLILLEIGGNDLLGGTTSKKFEAGLKTLLTAVCRPGRTVVMLELPLPPGYNRYGIAQRRLARKFGVLLVPKRILLGILIRDGATVDTIHLSPTGHRWMGDALWGILRPAFGSEGPSRSTRRHFDRRAEASTSSTGG